MSTPPVFLFVLLAIVTQVRADDFTDVKQAVQLRSGAIQELKERGVFREGPGGLLEGAATEIDPAQRNLLDAENADRTRLFQLIAQRSGTTPDEVARTFARKAAAAALPVTADKPSGVPAVPDRAGKQEPLPTAGADRGGSRPMASDRSSVLPLKVLTRPFANIYANPAEDAQKVQENVPGFSAYYVYQKTDEWYEVGSDDRGKIVGWMRADDVVEWKQNLVVEFTHPEGRQPVLMFGEKAPLAQLVATPQASRASQLSSLYRTIDGGNLPPDFPVQTMEPRRAVQSRDQFYLLPIVGFEEREIDGREGRLLQLAAATRKRGAILLTSDSDRAQLTRATDLKATAARGVKVDLVFVMDLSRSMGPFADRTIEMINECVRRIGADHQVVEAIRFGFWGYRDFPELCRGIEYNTRNYTLELQALPDFAHTLTGVQETKIDSIDYQEDVFAGLADAIQRTPWRPDTLRMIILVGDAPGRRPKETDPWFTVGNQPVGTKSGMNEHSIRHLADENNVYISGLYLEAPKWARYTETGERQFRTLSRNPNDRAGRENFRLLNARDTAIYGATAQSLADEIVDSILAAQGRDGTPPDPVNESPPGGAVETVEAGSEAGRELARNMFSGAMVEWLGKEDAATVPRDVTVWASDKDLIDPAIQSLDVQVFLTKNELNSLKLMVDQILNAGTRGKITGEDFFQALRAVVATTTTNPDQIRNAETLAKTGLVPEFLKGLPYRSTLMNMSNEDWRKMPPDAQDQFLRNVDSKLRFYQAVHDNSEKWQALNEGDDRDNWVAGAPLDQLP